MKRTLIYLYLFVFIINNISGLIFSKYQLTNLLIADFAICFSFILGYLVLGKDLKNGFKVSLSFINPIFCFVSLLLAIFMNGDSLKDNWVFFLLLILGFIQLSIFIIALEVSKSVK